MENKNCLDTRYHYVVKANELIQKSRFSLSIQQQKIILYLISQITPNDEDFKLYEFNIADFCKVCGIDYNGKNYNDLKNQIKAIRDKSIWITLEDGSETIVSWIEKPYIYPKSGKIKIRLDKDMKPFLLKLKENFTRYQLIYILYFKSKYSIRAYELLKSIHYDEIKEYKKQYNLEELKKLLDAEIYSDYHNLKQKVLDIAIKEINEYSDKIIFYKPIKTGRKVTEIEFTINTKSALEIIEMRNKIDKSMNNNSKNI